MVIINDTWSCLKQYVDVLSGPSIYLVDHVLLLSLSM